MTRASLSALGVVLSLGLAGARADIPPPKGQVRVPVDHIIKTDKAYPDYVFVVVVGTEADWSYKGELTPEKPLRIEAKGRGGRARLCWLAAVPAEAAKAYKTDKELLQAVVDGKVKGVLISKGADFSPSTVVPEKDAPKLIEEKHRIERITPADGIVLASDKVGLANDPDPHGFGEESAVRRPAAGVVAAVGVCGLGLWLIGRRRPG